MRSVTVIILVILVAQARAKQLVVCRLAHVQHSSDTLADRLVDKVVSNVDMLVNRALQAWPLHYADLDTTTQAKGKKIKPAPPALHDNFPGALPGVVLYERLIEMLTGYGFTSKNTIFGTSICPSEINTVDGSLFYNMKEFSGHWPSPLGGLGGAPSAGKSGFNELESHVPNGGNVVILFGSHVGITAKGEVGKFLHDGQKAPTDACDAVIEAYEECLKGDVSFDIDDMEESWLRQQIAPHVKRIKEAKNSMVELAKVSYEAILKNMKAIANTDSIGSGYLVLLGGIQINMPTGHHPDYFVPLHFTMARNIWDPDQNATISVPKDMLASLSKP